MNIHLLTNSESSSLSFHDCKKFGDASGYEVRLVVKSGGFGLDLDFYFEEWSLQQFILGVAKMEETLKGRADLKPMWEPGHMELELDDLGHVTVSGEFVEYSPGHQQMRFEFMTDQTCLTPLLRDLKSLAELK